MDIKSSTFYFWKGCYYHELKQQDKNPDEACIIAAFKKHLMEEVYKGMDELEQEQSLNQRSQPEAQRNSNENRIVDIQFSFDNT